MKKATFLFFLIPFLFNSCSPNNVDLRDDYVGSWSADAVGSITMIQNGTVLETIPTSSTIPMQITKQGSDQLDIEGLIVTVKGSKLIIPTSTQSQTTPDGFTMNITTTSTGTVSKTIISIKETYSGNWSYLDSTGTISGSTVYTLTKVQ